MVNVKVDLTSIHVLAYIDVEAEELNPKSIKLITSLMEAWAKSDAPEQGKKVEKL